MVPTPGSMCEGWVGQTGGVITKGRQARREKPLTTFQTNRVLYAKGRMVVRVAIRGRDPGKTVWGVKDPLVVDSVSSRGAKASGVYDSVFARIWTY